MILQHNIVKRILFCLNILLLTLMLSLWLVVADLSLFHPHQITSDLLPKAFMVGGNNIKDTLDD